MAAGGAKADAEVDADEGSDAAARLTSSETPPAAALTLDRAGFFEGGGTGTSAEMSSMMCETRGHNVA